jgi:TPP-dependent pyruvate/acetoin dehydrogenase alpha subunit
MARGSETDDTSRTGPTTRAERAAHYRDYAEQMRELADGEPNTKLRDRLMQLAAEYDALAASLDPTAQ